MTIGEAVAGGTVIIINSTGYSIQASTVTVNGGTVKAKATASYYAVYGNLEVNGGAVYLAGGDGNRAVEGSITAGTSVTLYEWDSGWGAISTPMSNKRYVTTDNTSGNPTAWDYWD